MFDLLNFDEIGKKIKVLAKGYTICGIISSIITGIVLLFSRPLIAVLVIVFGSIGSWASSFVLYGFGELVDKAIEIEHNMRSVEKQSDKKANEPVSESKETNKEEKPKVETWICKKCGMNNSMAARSCRGCGDSKPIIMPVAMKAESKKIEHRWRCNDCGSYISENPCPFCSKKEKQEKRSPFDIF